MAAAPLLEVQDLRVEIAGPEGPIPILTGLDLTLAPGESLGVVGESGCGKSMLALAVMGLLPDLAQARGAVRFEGRDLLALNEAELCRLRGRRLAMIFQEPMTSLNPVKTVGRQVAEGLRLHAGLGRAEALARAAALLARVGLPAARFPLTLYPHQLSGGQRQRVMIAMALACEPALLIADEPTTALDVTIQRQILDLLLELAEERGMALLLITHDLGVVAETTDRSLVMYAGQI
ncbi:MAG TPA: ABC transporter ATP-binding protein, partial [Kiloniellaceae bacterium]|nr:ABC transporter ATP-binding protein [Kiloniellaceae bacterium]